MHGVLIIWLLNTILYAELIKRIKKISRSISDQ